MYISCNPTSFIKFNLFMLNELIQCHGLTANYLFVILKHSKTFIKNGTYIRACFLRNGDKL
jgi:hypothetical protein